MMEKAPSPESLMQQVSILQEENQQLKQSLQAAKNNAELYENLVELAADAIFIGDPSGNIIGANQRAVHLSGYSYAELVGMNIGHFFLQQNYSKLHYNTIFSCREKSSNQNASSAAKMEQLFPLK